MAKRYLLVLALAAGVATGAFAQSLWSVGGGLMFDTGFGSGEGEAWSASGGSVSGSVNIRQTGFGVWAFVDATFAEFSLAIMRGSQTIDHPMVGEHSGSVITLDATLLGKLPIFFGWGDIFPLLGVGYQLDIAPELELYRWFTPRIVFGVGSDLDLTRNVFVRASILGSFRFVAWDWWPYSQLDILGDTTGWGVTIKAGIGFRL